MLLCRWHILSLFCFDKLMQYKKHISLGFGLIILQDLTLALFSEFSGEVWTGLFHYLSPRFDLLQAHLAIG